MLWGKEFVVTREWGLRPGRFRRVDDDDDSWEMEGN